MEEKTEEEIRASEQYSEFLKSCHLLSSGWNKVTHIEASHEYQAHSILRRRLTKFPPWGIL